MGNSEDSSIRFLSLTCLGTLGRQLVAGWTGNDLASGHWQSMLGQFQGKDHFEGCLLSFHRTKQLMLGLKIDTRQECSQPKREDRHIIS